MTNENQARDRGTELWANERAAIVSHQLKQGSVKRNFKVYDGGEAA